MHGIAGVHGGGACMVGACMAGRACVAGGTCMAGGMHGRGHAWQGVHAPPSRYYEMWSMSGQYASYWNAFLFGFKFMVLVG